MAVQVGESFLARFFTVLMLQSSVVYTPQRALAERTRSSDHTISSKREGIIGVCHMHRTHNPGLIT